MWLRIIYCHLLHCFYSVFTSVLFHSKDLSDFSEFDAVSTDTNPWTNSVSESFFRWRNTEDAALEMMNMSPAILNYTVKFNQTVAAVQYNDTNSSFSSLHCVFISRSLRFITPESPRLLLLRFSSLRCDGFDFRAEVRIRLCFSVILHPHRLKTERENTINQI